MSLKGWIIYNGYLPSEKFLDFAEWLHLAAKKQAIDTTIYKNNEILSMIYDEDHYFLPEDISKPDFVLFTDKDIYLAKQLELAGIPVFNSARTIEISDDKIASYQHLSHFNLPTPKTIIAPKTFFTVDDLNIDIDKIISTLGLPLIIKEAFGSFGEQVYLAHDKAEIYDYIHKISGKPFVFQRFIESSYGMDLRLHVVGDEVVAAMKRVAHDNFKANITSGGSMTAYEPTIMEKEIAIKATKAIGAYFAGVDLLIGPNGDPIICEINSNAHIHNMYDATGINVANFIVSEVKRHI